MYEALVARVRYHIQKADFMGLKEAESTLLLAEAADAIEALSKLALDEHNRAAVAAWERRWIPVSERLPEETGTYLVWMKWDLTEADEEPSAYPVLYDADAEGFGWWKSYYSGETLGLAGEDFVRYEGITHWMPLPEPPKEEIE